MKYDWPFVGKIFLVGVVMSVLGIFLVIYLGCDEVTILYLGIGSLLLVCSVMLALVYLLIARHGTSYLPENWDNLSFEEKRVFARKQLLEKNSRSSRAALWMMQMTETQRRHS